MNKEITRIIMLVIIAVVIMMSEVVSCQWHADDLTNGCTSNPFECLHKEKAHEQR